MWERVLQQVERVGLGGGFALLGTGVALGGWQLGAAVTRLTESGESASKAWGERLDALVQRAQPEQWNDSCASNALITYPPPVATPPPLQAAPET